LGSKFWAQGLEFAGFRVKGLGFREWGIWSNKVEGIKSRVKGLGFRIWGLRFKVSIQSLG